MSDWLRIAADPAASRETRLAALSSLVREDPDLGPGGRAVPRPTGEVNNHIHTIYSFSPHSPAMAAWKAREAGLLAAGSVDHDSVGAALEMLEACSILGIGSTVGFELRVSVLDTPFGDRKLNSPDSEGIIYMVIHGLPRSALAEAAAFLKPIAKARGERNRLMTATISSMLVSGGASAIDYDRDVLPLSKAAEGGSVTERHILAAAAASILKRWSPGPALLQGLSKDFGLEVPAKIAGWLTEPGNLHRLYDLLGLLKTGFLEKAFIQPGPGECIPAAQATAFARAIGAIPAYAYLGDVGESPTGDKKAERFEDAFLDDLVPALVDLGFQAITYMPPRNTKAQLARVRDLASRHGLMEISGVDINSSRQSFSCPEIREPGSGHLIEATWALIAHEKLSSLSRDFGLFSPRNPLAGRPLPARLAAYAQIGRNLDLTKPEDPDMLKALAASWRL